MVSPTTLAQLLPDLDTLFCSHCFNLHAYKGICDYALAFEGMLAKFCRQLFISVMLPGFGEELCGVSADTRASKVSILVRQERNLVQHNSVAGVGTNF